MSTIQDLTIQEMLQSIASTNPTPGGGAVAAYTGALAVALACMSLGISFKKKSFLSRSREEQEQAWADYDVFVKARETYLAYYELDMAAFSAYIAGTPYSDESLKEEKLLACYQVPHDVATFSLTIGELLMKQRPYVVKSVFSDYQMALFLLETTLKCSAANMKINLTYLHQPSVSNEAKQLIEVTIPSMLALFQTKEEE